MNFYLVYILNLCIYIPGILALVRFRNINAVYHPFLLALWIGCFNEVLSMVLIKQGFHTLVNNNVYVLVEGVLITLLFERLQLFARKSFFYIVLSLLVGTWLLDNVVFGTVTHNSTWYRIVYAFVIVLMSVRMMSEVVMRAKENLLKDATFLLCVSFVLYYTFLALVQSLVLYGVSGSKAFMSNLYAIHITINLLTNLLFIVAVLRMPRRFAYAPSW